MTRSRSWTHLTKTATKIPLSSCNFCVTTSPFGPVTRRVSRTNNRRVATTNLPKLKSFLNLIRTSYSLSSPRPSKCSPVHPPEIDLSIYLSFRPSRTSFPLLPSILPAIFLPIFVSLFISLALFIDRLPLPFLYYLSTYSFIPTYLPLPYLLTNLPVHPQISLLTFLLVTVGRSSAENSFILNLLENQSTFVS